MTIVILHRTRRGAPVLPVDGVITDWAPDAVQRLSALGRH